MKILIAEDSEILSKVMTLILTNEGYEVVTAIDGREAYNKFKEVNPDMILTDMYMPHYNGIELATMVRRESSIPIIIISGADDIETREGSSSAGINDYILKPFDVSDLKSRVSKLLPSQ